MKDIKLFSMNLQRFARTKNALRGHFIAEYTPGEAMPNVSDGTKWLELAKWISNIDDDTDEETDDTGFYDGDGTPETTVVSVAIGYSVEGFYDSQDPAQKLIKNKKRKVGDGRKVWHMVVDADQVNMWIGRATVTDIVAGGGDATEFEAFSCSIRYDSIPSELAAAGVGVPANVNGSTDVVPTAVTISGAAPTIKVGATVDLGTRLGFTPTTATVRTGSWATTDKTVATVNQAGIVTGLKIGTATIVFVTTNGLVAQVVVTVEAA